MRTLVLILGMAIASQGIGLSIFSATAAQAAPSSPPTLEEQKQEWQDRYRKLLREAARLQQNAMIGRENYSRAQRRNYPRGGAREQFLTDAEAAEKELVKVKAEIEGIFDEARHAAVPANWLYQVDDENVSYTPPASATEDTEDRAGRNPLYFKDEEEN